MGLPRTMVPSSVVKGRGSSHVRAPSRETRTKIRDVDQVAPGRTTLKSHTTPSGACQTTGLPSGDLGRGVTGWGADHLASPLRNLISWSVESSVYSPEPP